MRALDTGDAFRDAVRPGTVEQGRIMPGMMGGEFEGTIVDKYAVPLAGRWNASGYYDPTTLALMEHTGYKISDPIPCKYGDTFSLVSFVYGGSVCPAVVFNASGVAVEVLGMRGAGDWTPRSESVTVSKHNAASISFITGTSYVAKTKVSKHLPIVSDEITANAQGYLHMHAKNRTDTITDRAQIKLWYDLTQTGRTNISIPMRLFRSGNISGWTFRVFASTTESSYDMQLPVSAAAYTFDVNEGLLIHIDELPDQTPEGEQITHLSLFVDLIARDPAQYMDAYMLKPIIAGAAPVVADLHGALDSDQLNDVPPNARGSKLYGKKLLGMGDSLMQGGRLPRKYSWLNVLGDLRDMDVHNAGVNGSPVGAHSIAGEIPSMRSRIDAALAAMTPDYFILTGGANDQRLKLTPDGLIEAVTEIIGKVRKKNPRCKILLGTNWHRFGGTEPDYVSAMLEAAEINNVPVVNNYAHGLDMSDPDVRSWADEGLLATGTPDRHFSIAANQDIAAAYVSILESI